MLQLIINKDENQEVMIISSKEWEVENKKVYIKAENEETTKESKLYTDIQKLLSDFLA